MRINSILKNVVTAGSLLAVVLVASGLAYANQNVTPGSVAFGNQTVGSVSAPATVTFTNTSSRTVKVSHISSSRSQFSYSAPSLPASVAPGQTLAVTVKFLPSAAQAYFATLNFSFSTFQRGGFGYSAASLTGTGIAPSTSAPKPPVTSSVAPSITSQPASKSVTVGQTATFSVSASGTSPMTYQWSRNGAPIAGATSPAYITPATTAADNGSAFSVVASNTAGNATSSAATLTVAPSVSSVAPAITSQPANKSISAGQTATFTVACSGTSPMTYQWNKNGGAIAGATSSTYVTPAATSADSGSKFTVAVGNTMGSATSAAATLTVAAPTAGTLTLSASTLSFGTVTDGSNSSQTVSVTNTGAASVSISNVTISGAGFTATGISSGLILTPSQAATLNVLFAPSSTSSVTGSITVASNAANSTATISLSGTGKAAPVASSASLSWTPSTSNVVGYNVYSSTVSSGPFAKLTSGPVASTNYTDGTVQSGKTYYYMVTSVNSANVESADSNQATVVVP